MEKSNLNSVLIVDDTPDNIKILGTILVENGFFVSVAQSGIDALEIVENSIPDLILLDINMPQMDGLETCRKLKKNSETAEIPVIFLTSYTDTEHKINAFAAGGVDYITKPFQKEEVLSRVKTHLEIEKYKRYLEDEVKKRTYELQIANKKLKIEIIKNKQAEDALRQAQKMELVGTLAGGLAHDFNNILGGITGSLSLMEMKLNKNDELSRESLEKYIHTMKYSAEGIASMVKQLLSLSRKQEVTLVPVDLNKSIRNVMKIAESSFDKSVVLSPEYNEKPATVNADPIQIEQILLNLCINASHAMTIMRDENEIKGGELAVFIDKIECDDYFQDRHPTIKDPQCWGITVKDTGIGMTEETIEKIFNPFFTTKVKGLGTGLGLAMVQKIIENHNGAIEVYSEPGKGCEFKIYIPVLNYEIEHHIFNNNEEIPVGEGLILLVDDNEIMRDVAAEIFIECGYDVMSAENGLEALDLYEKNKKNISAVLLDMNMPQLSGKDTFGKLKILNPEVKVLLTSGFREDEEVQNLINLGASGFLQKPYALKKMALMVEEVLK